MKFQWMLRTLTAFTLVAVGAVSFSVAEAATNIVKEDDHLVCYKSKDAVKPKLKGTVVDVLMERFGSLTNCKIKKMTEYCVSGVKRVTNEGGGLDAQPFEPGLGDDYGRRELSAEFACFKFKCDRASQVTTEALSQFGVHRVVVGKAGKICLPTLPETCDPLTFVDFCRDQADETSCNASWNVGRGLTPTSCFWGLDHAGSGPGCFGCSPDDEDEVGCDNICTAETVPTCEDNDLTRADSCRDFYNDQTGCENAYQFSGGTGLPVSCMYGANGDSSDPNSCVGCGPFNSAGGFCTNSCSSDPGPSCADDARSFAELCRRVGDEAGCESSWSIQQEAKTPVSCTWDTDGDQDVCAECNTNGEFEGLCTNTCTAP